jgi:erythronate-4-phosphate dehydrogenase
MILLADRHIPWLEELLPAGVERIRFDGGRPPDELLARADALLVRTVTRVDASLLRAAPKLRWLGTATAGFDHIDTQAVTDAGVHLFVAAGCNASAVGDYVGGSWLAVSGLSFVVHNEDASPPTIAVVGCGHTGTAAAARLEQLGVEVVAYDPPLGLPATWDQVLACDAVSVHVPLTLDGPHKTRHLLSAADFKRARWRFLIQASRGGVVDESALKSWIRSGGTAVVDVWENEPDIDPDLCALAALATPHIAGYSVQAKFRATRMCVDALRRTLDAGRWTPDVGRRTLDVADRQPPTAAVLRDLSDALKASPTAETFNSLRNESPLRVEAE